VVGFILEMDMDHNPSVTPDGKVTGKVVTDQVITARKLEGTAVYSATGEPVGRLEDVMIDKVSGKVAYAVLGFGGFLGMGERHHPLPWSILKYNTEMSAYVVALDGEILKDAPSFGSSDEVCWADEGWGRRVHDYYKAEPYWTSGP
jgi:PRC-barrel domain